jgi:Na+-translocating ferredoxin:NAD+ oxidoreductase RnfD subunit
MFNFKSIKTKLIIYLICFALYLALKEHDFVFLFKAFLAAAAAVIIESLILYFKVKKIQISESPVITGLIIGYVLSADEAWWKFVGVCILAIGSKHVIRFKKKHIFNPAVFGIFIATVLWGVSTQWKGTYGWYVLIPLGVYFIYKINKIELFIGYAVSSLVLFGAQAYLQKINPLNIFGYFSYFYIFVMVIEPKTSPIKKTGKYLFGVGLAVLIFLLTEEGVKFDAELCALLVLNMFVPLLNKIPERRRLV